MTKKACIIDIDGVVCDSSARQARTIDSVAMHRGDWATFIQSLKEYAKTTEGDTLIFEGASLVSMLREFYSGCSIIYLTSRNTSSHELTLQWLEENDLLFEDDILVTSPEHKPDENGQYTLHSAAVYKQREAERLIEEYEILIAVDDNAETCRMYRDLGIPALQALWPNVDCLSAVGDPKE